MVDITSVLSKYKLFWQYPVITEQEFYNQNKNQSDYFGFPWATIIDKRYDLNEIYNVLKPLIPNDKTYYTCCQHIYFRRLSNLWVKLGINVVYTPHKVKGEDILSTPQVVQGAGEIKLKPCPLYAVNYENGSLRRIENQEKHIRANFIGGYQSENYLTSVRLDIFELNKCNGHKAPGWGNLTETNGGPILIINTGEWHFNKIVYARTQNYDNEYPQHAQINDDASDHNKRTEFYNNVLINSSYTLSPSGSGPNSIRFWEALSVGSIPILLADTLELPKLPDIGVDWEDSILVVEEKDVFKIPSILQDIDNAREKRMSKNCIKIYNFLRNNYTACQELVN